MVFDSHEDAPLGRVVGALLKGLNRNLHPVGAFGKVLRRSGKKADVGSAHPSSSIDPLLGRSDFLIEMIAASTREVVSNRGAANRDAPDMCVMPNFTEVSLVGVRREKVTRQLGPCYSVFRAIVEESKQIESRARSLLRFPFQPREMLAKRISRQAET